jgi:hypothetical protein
MVKLLLCLIKHRVMDTYERVGVKFHALFSCALDEGEQWQRGVKYKTKRQKSPNEKAKATRLQAGRSQV